jgi:hypothetical protein
MVEQEGGGEAAGVPSPGLRIFDCMSASTGDTLLLSGQSGASCYGFGLAGRTWDPDEHTGLITLR